LSPEDLDAFLVVAKKHKVLAFEVGDVKVTFSQLALVPEVPVNPLPLQPVKEPERKPQTYQGFSEEQLFGGTPVAGNG
jgi:hypothetical protein